jgi:hypothetical protein
MKWLELSKRLADTIRNSDLSESRRKQLVLWLDGLIDKRSVFAKDISKEHNVSIEFDASVIIHSPLLTEELYGLATEPMRVFKALDYSERLEKAVEQYVDNANKERRINLKACSEVMDAVVWIRFWAMKGFGYDCEM